MYEKIEINESDGLLKLHLDIEAETCAEFARTFEMARSMVLGCLNLKIVGEEGWARILHESGREAVEKGKVLVKDPQNRSFVEWDDLPEDAKEGRMMQARYILRNYGV